MGQPARILIVDDEPQVRSALSRVLRQTNLNIDTAEGAKEALSFMEKGDYNLILSDLKMPETDGIELLTMVSELYPETSRMLLSGHAERHDLNEAINQCKVDQYLDKPWDNQQLVATVTAITEENQHKRQRLADAGHMDRELNSAMALQLSTLPEEIDAANLNVKWMFQSCFRLGGDGLNYWMRDDQLHFFMLDVAGHGASAAMESFALQHMLCQTDLSNPAAATQRLHDNYLYQADALRYFTMISGCLDVRSRKLTFCQAGHPAPLLVNKEQFEIRRVGEGGFPVGLLESVHFENQELTVGEKEMLILHSDGLAENRCENFEAFLLLNSCVQPNELADKVVEWRNGNPIEDDISALFISLPA